MIELRSDTFTLPTRQMLEAVVQAPLGNDGYGEDPTTARLEERAAELTAKEAACFMPSGTMANLASIMAHAPRGSKILVGAESDVYVHEACGASVCGGVAYEPLPNQADGRILIADLAAGFPPDPHDPEFALPALICLETTHNRCGGSVLPIDYLEEVRTFARDRDIRIHLDGARLFNAAVALGVAPARITEHVDSVQFCLSKGLGAPVGSIVAGDAGFVRLVRRIRKMLGGGMRQTGVLAAAGLVGLDQYQRLAGDHENARRLAEGLALVKGLDVDPSAVTTNIVMFGVCDDRFTLRTFVEAAARHGVAVSEFGHGRIRAVCHSGVSAADVDEAVSIMARLLDGVPLRAAAAG